MDVLLKKPFVRVNPPSADATPISMLDKQPVYENDITFKQVSQGLFMTEFHPSGHKINSEIFYPNKITYDEEKKRFFTQNIQRVAVPLQQVITTQQLVHLTSNDINIELTESNPSESDVNNLFLIKKGWLDKNMETAFYELARSVKVTGDGALCFFLNDKKIGVKALSFCKGDTLFPHYDDFGNLEVFARRYAMANDDGETLNFVEVYTKSHFYLFQQDHTSTSDEIADSFGLGGYSFVESKPHGFNVVPIVYVRDNGPCWEQVQSLIEDYELALSYLAQNNMAYAFPIMLLSGDDIHIEGDIYGRVKGITMSADSKVSYLERGNGTDSFRLQLETLLHDIFLGSYIVKPPEPKSGDLPGVAIKLIYAPSLDKAIIDCKFFDRAIDEMLRLFLYGYGIEMGKTTEFLNLGIIAWAEPYVHQNTAEFINNLAIAVNSKFLSNETASELSGLGKNGEINKIRSDYEFFNNKTDDNDKSNGSNSLNLE